MKARPEVTMCYVCEKCDKVVQQQTFPNQTYIEVKSYICIKCNLPMKHHLVIIQGHRPLDPTPIWMKKKFEGDKDNVDKFNNTRPN